MKSQPKFSSHLKAIKIPKPSATWEPVDVQFQELARNSKEMVTLDYALFLCPAYHPESSVGTGD